MSFAAPKETFKSFVTEKEIEEKKKVRQAEWENVRKPDQPLQAPDEPIDNRTLYDRLKEQKLKEQEEKEEARKLKNFVRGLEHDEVEFLDQLDDIYVRMEREKQQEEKKAIMEFRDKLAAVQTEAAPIAGIAPSLVINKRKEDRTLARQSSTEPPKKRQKDLLAGVVKIRRLNSGSSDEPLKSPAQLAEELPEQSPASTSDPVSSKNCSSIALLVAYGSDSDSE